ncbi:MAG: hypothetical protein KUG78_06005 [Kangiellaceae bacterium]|nr:hypothetical protein [Kangiellaceae bacterium]
MECKNRTSGYFPGSFFQRSHRIKVLGKGIFYRIREGQSLGPFASLSEAETDLRAYIRSQNPTSVSQSDKKMRPSHSIG